MPLGTIKYSGDNERPFGLCAAAPTGGEGLLLRELNICGCEQTPNLTKDRSYERG